MEHSGSKWMDCQQPIWLSTSFSDIFLLFYHRTFWIMPRISLEKKLCLRFAVYFFGLKIIMDKFWQQIIWILVCEIVIMMTHFWTPKHALGTRILQKLSTLPKRNVAYRDRLGFLMVTGGGDLMAQRNGPHANEDLDIRFHYSKQISIATTTVT